MSESDATNRLLAWYRAAVAAADPGAATASAVREIANLAGTAWIIALGKGAQAMASGALTACRTRGMSVAGGLVITHAPDESATHGLPVAIGDHPVPGAGSSDAAARLATLMHDITPTQDAIVLVSGGATSLAAGPAEGIESGDLPALFEALLASGADIELMNAIRKRALRWGAGRLATMLGARRVHCLIASDVPSNDVAFIASGPCVPDELSASDVLDRIDRAGLRETIPAAVIDLLDRQAAGNTPETPKPDHPRFASTTTRIILDRHVAANAAASAARAAGMRVLVETRALNGDAAAAGEAVARQALVTRGPRLLVWSGETTVQLGDDPGRGGRCQELALSAARILHDAGTAANGITILAAGTDGRDGPTDAAGAVADNTTWSRVAQAGVDPAQALQRHDAFTALDAAGALIRTGPTGTNVNDIVLTVISDGGWEKRDGENAT